MRNFKLLAALSTFFFQPKILEKRVISELSKEELKEIANKKQQKFIENQRRKGLKLFEFGTEKKVFFIWAINQQNADRKLKNLQKKIK